jgi:DNA-binding beta-propeller fold protein YncE
MLLSSLIILLAIGGFESASSIDYDLEGNLYVVDRGRNLLVKFSPDGDSLMAVGGRGSGPLQFDEPIAVYARRGSDVYVADRNNHRIQRFDRNLDFVSSIETRDGSDERGRFGYPSDIALTRQGDVLIVDTENRRVLRVDALGQVFTPVGGVGAGGGRLVEPTQVEVDGEDFLYVLDGGRIAVFDPFGSYVEDLPLPIPPNPRAFSIDRDTLVVADSMSAIVFSLSPRSVLGAAELPGTPTSIRMLGGRLIVTESKRAFVGSAGD